MIVPVAISPGMRVNISPAGWIQIRGSLLGHKLGSEISHYPNCDRMFTYDSYSSNCGLIQVWDLGPPQSPLFLCKNDNSDDWWVCTQRTQSHLCSGPCDDTVPSECFIWYARVFIFSDLHSKRRPIILQVLLSLAMRESFSPIGWIKVWMSSSHLRAKPKYM